MRQALEKRIMFDKTLRQDVLDELDFDPSLDSTNIGVTVHDGVATLSGFVSSYAQKLAAVSATRRVKGVQAIADEIVVRHPEDKKTSDDQIAKRALDILKWDVLVPPGAIDVTVRNGMVTLSGEVRWHYQRSSAESDVRKLSGVQAVLNNIAIKPQPIAANVRDKIESALRRSAEIEAKEIKVRVAEGGEVYLDGRVHSLKESMAAANAAWAAPGVAQVHNRLIVA
jgi:hyperosmotically inducible protein